MRYVTTNMVTFLLVPKFYCDLRDDGTFLLDHDYLVGGFELT